MMETADEAAGSERRRHERFLCDGHAEVVSFRPELLFRGEVKDISLTGCYIATRARLSLRRFAEIELRFSAHGSQLSLLGRVMDVRPGKGLGVQFLPVTARAKARFLELIGHLKAKAVSQEEQASGRRSQQEVSAGQAK